MDEQDHSDEVLRSRALQIDEAASRQLDLGSVWRELVNGEARVKGSFHSEERCYLVLDRARERRDTARQAEVGKVRILETILLEGAQKEVAIEWGLSPSTVAGALKQCLERLGVSGTTSRISPLLVSAAYASQADAGPRWARSSELMLLGHTYQVVSVPRPEAKLAGVLTPAQYEVIRLLMEGKSHEAIARARNRSTRTIANQLGAVFRKLGVSGRTELIRALVRPEPGESAGEAPGRLPLGGVVKATRLGAPQPGLQVRRYRLRPKPLAVPASL